MKNTAQDTNNLRSNWNAFQNKAKQSVVFSNFAYKQTDEAMKAMANQLPEGYELFLMTDHADKKELGKASFRCAAFVNHATREIVFTTAGTRPQANKKGLHDLIDDGMLIAHNKPRKMKSAQILNEMVLDSLGDEAKNYKFHFTGHSLGAAMAEIQAADMDIRLTDRGQRAEHQISAITFENPGTKPIVEKMYRKAGMKPNEHIPNLQFHEFNNRDNLINTLNQQTGKTYTIIPDQQKERNPTRSQMVFAVLSRKVESKMGPLAAKVFKLLSPGGVSDNLMSEHRLANFDTVLVKEQGGVQLDQGRTVLLKTAYAEINAETSVANKPIQEKSKSNSILNNKNLQASVKKVVNEMKGQIQEKASKTTKRVASKIPPNKNKGHERY